jgi:hypothetical protein
VERDGYRFAADNDQVFDFTMSPARSDVGHEVSIRWLEANSERLEAT